MHIGMHEYEQIDEFIANVKQTVWVINYKLQESITKLMFLQSKLRVTLGRDPDQAPSPSELAAAQP